MTGTYTDIKYLNISPASPVAGDTVVVNARVLNLYSAGIYSRIVVKYNDTEIVTWEGILEAGEIRSVVGSFTMPSTGVTVTAYSYYKAVDGVYYLDDQKSVDLGVVEEELELLEVKIDPSGAGYVTVSPTPTSGVQHLWYFSHGTIVEVTAHPNSGYKFKSWSGEMTDTTAITAPVYPMTEKRTITAHFEATDLETLEVKVDPSNGGYVTTKPASEEGKTTWRDGDTGKFVHGTRVEVTAHPSSGYLFESWSGEMTDTTAITAPVYPMTEKRTITAHFKAEAEINTGIQVLEDSRVEERNYMRGDSVPFNVAYRYKGKEQDGTLTIELGTGVLGFTSKFTVLTQSIHLSPSRDYVRDEIAGNFSIPQGAEIDQTYSVRFKIVTDDGEQDDETDWGALKVITEEEEEEGLNIISLTLDKWGKVGEALGTSKVTLSPTDTLRVQSTITYTAPKDFRKEYWVSFVIEPARDKTVKSYVELPKAATQTTKQVTTDIPILSDDPNLKNDTYDLWIELVDLIKTQDKVKDAVTITDMPVTPSPWELIPAMMMVMMMGIMVPMMEEI